MNFERDRLVRVGRPDLAAKVERVSLNDSSAGYDIKSFDEDGVEILIEVKTTKSDVYSPFYISQNEIKVASINHDNYYLYRVHSLDLKNNSCDIYIKNGSVEDIFDLEPVSYKAKVK